MRLLIWVLVAAVLVWIAIYGVRRLRPSLAGSALLEGQQEDYVRVESEAELAFYKSYADFYEETPPELARFVEEIATTTGLDRRQDSYPVDGEALHGAASAFAAAARAVFSFDLSIENPDPEQLDLFANRHLISESLQKYFDGAGTRADLSDEELEQYYLAAEANRVPDEPLLYYAMGAFWGEWLVRHQEAEWALFEPLRPVQSFPDMVTGAGTICLHPFSQVGKKLADPEGDQLAFKVAAATQGQRYFPPYPLTAALADSEVAAAAAFPPEARQALKLQSEGDQAGALPLFRKALERGSESARLYSLAIPCAWSQQEWNLVHQWSLEALELEPDHPMLNHNLAVLYSNNPDYLQEAVALLQRALEADPNYARAHLTLAACYLDLGDTEMAIEHATWVRDNDFQLQEEATAFLEGVR